MKPVILLFAVLTLALAPGEAVEMEFFNVVREMQSGDVMVTWATSKEDGVDHFEVLCQTPNTMGYQVVATVPAHGAAKPYKAVHRGLYKTSDLEASYKLAAVLESGFRDNDVSAPVSVNYVSTAMRRTWGSIKAMFQ